MNKPAALPPPHILLVEPVTLLRRTVSLTIRSLGLAAIAEAATYPLARQELTRRSFDGAVIAVDASTAGEVCEGLTLLQRIRSGDSASAPTIPVAVLVEACDAKLLRVLGDCGVARVLIKPFRARDVIDTIEVMARPVATAAAS